MDVEDPPPEALSNAHYGLPEPPPVPEPPTGLYLFGGVGTGKSLLMDLLYAATGGIVRHRRRVHFHSFLLEVYARLHVHSTARRAAAAQSSYRHADRTWESMGSGAEDGEAGGVWEHPLAAVAREMIAAPGHSLALGDGAAGGAWSDGNDRAWLPHEENALLLCFDEFQLNEVGDALLLRGLLDQLFRMGVVVVTTSNRPPEELNRNATGWQQQDYQRFLEVLRR